MLELSVADLLRSRFAISPVREVIEVARALADPEARAAHADWLREQRAGLQRIAHAHNLRPLFALTRAHGSMPDFLRPTPRGPMSEIGGELERIRATPAEQVHAEIGRCLRANGPVAADVELALRADGTAGRLADLLAAIWAGLVQPSWSTIRASLERDILYQSRALARHSASPPFCRTSLQRSTSTGSTHSCATTRATFAASTTPASCSCRPSSSGRVPRRCTRRRGHRSRSTPLM